MAEVLNANLGKIDCLDISSGYFDLRGYGKIRQRLQEAADSKGFTLRLLLGKNAISPPQYDTFEEYQNRAMSVKDALDNGELDRDGMTDVAGLMRLLGQDNVHVRHNDQRFNHSKCYILGDEGAIVGSSNFTYSGFQRNDELNVCVYQPSTWDKIKEWYDRMWAKASDAKDELIQVLEQSKFGTPPDPHDVYIKMLFEMYRPALLAMENDQAPERKSKLVNFQKDAVSTAIQMMSYYGGAIIADATGLGKTYIGIEIMHQKLHGERRKVLLVAPAQVLKSVWHRKLKDAGIAVEEVSMEKLGRRDFLEEYPRDVYDYADCDLVVVDESQNFRSKGANRRENLMRIMTLGGRKKKQVVLLTATPINNSIMDLYYQLSIITGHNDAHFWDMGIPNLYRHMKSAATREGLGEGLEKIHQILDAVMVRRTRLNIKEIYGDQATLDGKPIRFPEREYRPITYDLSDGRGDIYATLAEAVESLKMAPYGIEQYNTTLNDEDRKKHRILASLQVIHMLKRFESSTEAVRISLDNKIRLYRYFQRVLGKGEIFSVKQFNRIRLKLQSIEDDNEEEIEDCFMKEVEKIPTRSSRDYDVATIQKHVESDLKVLDGLRKEIEAMADSHEKFNAVVQTIRQDRALESGSKKVLIFTEYADTAKYLKDMVDKTFGDKETLLLTGNTKPDKRQEYIERFAPEANLGGRRLPSDIRQADILISTEVLAEGQNLQDCNYVINYDLPWNPMRIVQRVGRIDRLTSEYETVHSRACYPHEKLNDLLQLMAKLIDKINTIVDVIGPDGTILEEDPKRGASGRSPIFENSVRSITVLAGADKDESSKIINRLEREDDLISDTFNEINTHVRREGIEKMKAVPMGRRSGKRANQQGATKAILAYVMEEPRRFYTVAVDLKSKGSQDMLEYLDKKYQARMVHDNIEAMRMTACGPGTPKHLPGDGPDGRESFEMLLEFDRIARETIKSELESNVAFAQDAMYNQRNDYERNFKRIKEKITEKITDFVGDGKISSDQGNEILEIIESHDLRSWVSRLKTIYDDYSDDATDLVKHLKKLGEIMGIVGSDQNYDDEPAPPDIARLKLAGAMFISE